MKKTPVPINPFTHGKIVSGDQFINRSMEIRRITKALRGRSNLLVMGDRRIGKTSLIHVVGQKLSKEGREVFYINLDPITSTRAFIERYAMLFTKNRSLGQRASELISRLIKGLRIDTSFAADGTPTFGLAWDIPSSPKPSDISEVLNIPHQLSKNRKKPFVVILDEFQNIATFQGDIDFIAELRNAVLGHENINYVFMGSETTALERLFSSDDEKFFNSVRKEPIGLISRSEFVRYIVEQFANRNVRVSQSIAESICEWSRDIPADIQHFCAVIWDSLSQQARTFTEEDFPHFLQREIEYQDEHFLQLWKALPSEKDRSILRELARRGPTQLTKEFCYTTGMDKTTIYRRLKGLSHGQLGFILHKRRDGYYFSDPFFEEWVRQMA